MDLVLSSGFLAFARQCGFLQAVEQAGVPVDGLCGTSSGALAGALWAAGHDASFIAAELSRSPPLRYLRLHARPWRGAFSLRAMVVHLRTLLPERIEHLDLAFGVGVMTPDGRARLITEGPLAEAVAASCAIPRLFEPVALHGVPCADGGLVDRHFLDPWRARRGGPVLLHLVDPSRGPAQVPEGQDLTVVRTARSGAAFWSLGDFAGQQEEARLATLAALHDRAGSVGQGGTASPQASIPQQTARPST